MGSSCSALPRDCSGTDAASFEQLVVGGNYSSGAPQPPQEQHEDDHDEGVVLSPVSTVGQSMWVHSPTTTRATTAKPPPNRRTDVVVGKNAAPNDTNTDFRREDFKQLLEFTAASAVSSDSSASAQSSQNKLTTMRRYDSDGSGVQLGIGAGGGLSSSAASVHRHRHTPKLVASSFVSSTVMLSNNDFVLSPATTEATAAAAAAAAVEISFQQRDVNNKAVAQAQQQQQQQLVGMKSQQQHPDKRGRSQDGNTTGGMVLWSIFNADDVIQLTERSPSTSISGGDAGGDCVLLLPLVRPEQEWHAAAFT